MIRVFDLREYRFPWLVDTVEVIPKAHEQSDFIQFTKSH